MPIEEVIHSLFDRKMRPDEFLCSILLSKACDPQVYSQLWDSLPEGQLDANYGLAIGVVRRINDLELLNKVGSRVASVAICQNSENYYGLIHGFIDLENFEGALELFEQSYEKSMIKGSELMRLFRECCKRGHFDLVDRIFTAVKNGPFLDAEMLDNYIKAAFQAGQVDKATDAFLSEARSASSVADEECFITFMVNHPNFDRAFEAYTIGKAALANPTPRFFNQILHRANQDTRYPRAEQIYKDAKDQAKADAITHQIYLAGFDVNPTLTLEKALRIFQSIQLLIVVKESKDTKVPEIDLHGFSHGAGKVALHYIRHYRGDLLGKSLTIICGKGREESGNFLAFRQALIAYIQRLWPRAYIDAHGPNLGCFKVTLPPLQR